MIETLLAAMAVAVLLAGLGLLDVVIRKPELAAVLVLGATVLTAAFGAAYFTVGVAGVDIRLLDVAFVMVVAAAVARLLRVRRFTTPARLLVLIGILFAVSTLGGIATYGLLPAVTESRQFLYFFGGVLYFVTVEYSAEFFARIAKIYLIAACVLSAVVLIRWAGSFVGVNIGPLVWEGNNFPIRAVSGPHTFFLSQALFLFMPVLVQRSSTLAQRFTGSALLVIVVLLNRRTVYLALIIGLVLVIHANKELGMRAFRLLIAAGVAVVIVLLVVPSETSEGEEVADAPTDTNTLVFRLEGWSALLIDGGPEGVKDWLVGQPMGSGYQRTLGDGKEVESNPHSFYVQTLLRLGAVGLLSLLGTYATTIRRLRETIRGRDTEALTALTLFVLLAAQVLWFTTWPPGPEQGLILGMALAYAGRVRIERAQIAADASRTNAHGVVPSERQRHSPIAPRVD
jgi:hypothetical protein